jgi:hypothetical protein
MRIEDDYSGWLFCIPGFAAEMVHSRTSKEYFYKYMLSGCLQIGLLFNTYVPHELDGFQCCIY